MKKILAALLAVVLTFSMFTTAFADDESVMEELKRGSRGKQVTELQKRLIELGYLRHSGADGDFGKMTATAVSNFQYATDRDVTGIADIETQQAIFAEDAPEFDPEKEFIPVSSLESVEHQYSIFQGDTIKPEIRVKPENSTFTDLVLETEDDFVTINEDGSITANGKGRAKIFARSTDGTGVETHFYMMCEPACPVSIEKFQPNRDFGNLLTISFRNQSQETRVCDICFDAVLKAADGHVISSKGYHTKEISLSAGSSYTIKSILPNLSKAASGEIRVTGVRLKNGYIYKVPEKYQEVTTW